MCLLGLGVGSSVLACGGVVGLCSETSAQPPCLLGDIGPVPIS